MNRTDIINALISKQNYKRYLEIGIFSARRNFDLIKCKKKIGVDQKTRGENIITKSSDEFFADYKGAKFGLIFIDGGHSYEQSSRDLSNAKKVIQKKGTIVLHDCLPLTEQEAGTIKPDNGNPWCGNVWQTWQDNVIAVDDNYIIDTDHGVGVVTDKADVDVDVDVVPPWISRSNLNIITTEKFVELMEA